MVEAFSGSSPTLLTGGSTPGIQFSIKKLTLEAPKSPLPKNNKAELILNELCSSEKQYVDVLKTIVEVIFFLIFGNVPRDG